MWLLLYPLSISSLAVIWISFLKPPTIKPGGRDHPKYWRNLYSRRSKKATATGAGGNPDPKQM